MRKQLKVIFSLIFVVAALTTGSLSAQDLVFTTKSGNKYHKKDCQHVKGKPDVASIALTKAKADRLEACKSCFTEDKKAAGTTTKDEKKPDSKANDAKSNTGDKKTNTKPDDKNKKEEKKTDTNKSTTGGK
jgi:hypothetical protein